MANFKFSFWAYGIFGISALCIFLSFLSSQAGNEVWANNFFDTGKWTAVLGFVIMVINAGAKYR